MSKDVLKDVKTFTDKPAYFTPHPIYDSYNEAVSKQAACEKLQLAPNKKYILFFGFIREYKGLDLLLEAMADERIVQAGIELLAAGEYYNKEVEANNNKIIEENFKLNLVSLDLRSLGLTLNKKPRPTQKSSFLDFISKRKNLEAKKFKLKMKYSETQLNRKQQILKLSSKMKNSRDSFKSSLL